MNTDSKPTRERVSPDQFEALAALISMQPGPSMAAARAVLVDGARIVDACAVAGIKRSGAHGAVQRVERALALARRAAGVPERVAGLEAMPLPKESREATAEHWRRYTQEEVAALGAGYEFLNVTQLGDPCPYFMIRRAP